jgi:hypothetical protein
MILVCYPDPVRVLIIGEDTLVEFCVSTHLDHTGEAEASTLGGSKPRDQAYSSYHRRDQALVWC